jgi:hypothetical protein
MAEDTNAKLHSLANQIWQLRESLAKLKKRRQEILDGIRAALASPPSPDIAASWNRRLNLWRNEYRMTDDLISDLNNNEALSIAAYNKALRKG